MKIAIFHNYLDNIGGAERVTLTLARELGADVVSTVVDQSKLQKLGFTIPVKTIGWIPTNAPFRQQAASFRFRLLDISSHYDFFIIAGDWAISAAVNHKPNLWYCYSPIREIWDYASTIKKTLVPLPLHPAYDMWAGVNRYLNRRYVSHVQKIVCDSKLVQQRVKKYLNRESDVIYPPVDTQRFYHAPADNYWLAVNRLFSHKRIELQLEAMRKLPAERLIIVGSYEKSRHFQSYARKIKQLLPPNVEIRSWVSEKELLSLYAHCRGLLATAHQEDFGLTPVEAMAAGKPVVAVDEGGYRETVIQDITGKLVPPSAEAIASAMSEVGKKSDGYADACRTRAAEFDTTTFISRISRVIYAAT
ncbi:MAG: glycosyltransferase [Candidatus Andersenbacteria bacterium]|nr:glycosyltransferase [Candidatus Andersenbacteria bacterium]MBI3250893.1 glycosyltransferase [Candidatus Andersenbacteria bacterium]